MHEIRSMIVTAKISEANKKKLNELVGEENITYIKPFSYPEMMEMMANGFTKEQVFEETQRQKSQLRKVVIEKQPDVAILGSDINDCILASSALGWIHCTHAGVEKSASLEIFDRNIILTSSAGRSASALAEHAIMFILALVYDMSLILERQKLHKWGLGSMYSNRTGLAGKTVGIIGMGHNGCELSKRLKNFEVRVIGYDRSVRQAEGADLILEANEDNLEKIASESDFLVLCVSLNDSTFHMIDAGIFKTMKPSSYLVNIARGGLVDEVALVAALQNHQIAGAGLDTFETEPLSSDSPLWTMNNVIITPHTTPVESDKEDKEWSYVFTNVLAYQNDGKYVNKLNKEDVYTAGKNRL